VPPTPVIPIQRWSIRRVGLLLGAAVTGLVTAVVAWSLFFGIQPDEVSVPRCPSSTPVLLAGQAVPGAAYAPCLGAVPAAWDVERVSVTDAALEMDVAVAGDDVPDGSLSLRFVSSSACPAVASTSGRSGGQPGVTVHDTTVDGRAAQVTSFDGGCVVLQVSGEPASLDDAGEVLRLVSRAELDQAARDLTGGWATTLTET
jgi:hypothetical protein